MPFITEMSLCFLEMYYISQYPSYSWLIYEISVDISDFSWQNSLLHDQILLHSLHVIFGGMNIFQVSDIQALHYPYQLDGL